MRRETVLDVAHDAICETRDDEYGDARECFSRIGRLWTAAFDREFSPTDVALAMDLVKTARILYNEGHLDSWIDKVGYSALGAEIATGVASS